MEIIEKKPKMNIAVVVAFSHKSFGIGKNGAIPWNIPEDMKHFKNTTVGTYLENATSTVVMGRKTFDSIKNEPLKNRNNIVLSSTLKQKDYDDLWIVNNFDELETELAERHGNTYIIGGVDLYKYFIGKARRIIATIIEKEWDCDTHLPTKNLHKYKMTSISYKLWSEEESCFFRFVEYELMDPEQIHGEIGYLNLMKDILQNGDEREDRTGTGTYSVFARQLKFNLKDGQIPILTTKQLGWQTVLKELLWFISGSTDSNVLMKQGVKIWEGNTSREFLDSRGLYDYAEGEIGPLYGASFRKYGGYIDQLENVVKSIKTDPYSRRHVMTMYDPRVVDQCVLMPCHGIAIQFHVEGGLSCHVYCRSSDTFLGLGFNIASYAMLTAIVAKKTGYEPHTLTISTGDTHIYKNHVEQSKTQLNRHPLPFPTLILSDRIIDVPFERLVLADFEVAGYIHHERIVAPMAI
jgi:dihydrofolate reductase/thymidylate synthase